MKILHIAYDCIPEIYIGGVQKVVCRLALEQVRLGNEVTVFANYNAKRHGNLGMQFQWEGINFQYFYPDGGEWSMRASSKSMRNKLFETANHFDIIHSHNPYSPLNSYAFRASRRGGKKLFYHLHGALYAATHASPTRFSFFKKWIYVKLFELRYYKQANGVFCLSKEEETDAWRWGLCSNSTDVVSNGVNFPVSKSVKEFTSEVRLLFVGRITPVKNLSLILDIFAGYIEGRNKGLLKLYLAGDHLSYPHYVSQLKDKIVELGIVQNVVWCGFVSGGSKDDLYRSAHAFIHMSHSEGMSMAILEAMSYGIPTIISEMCGFEEAEKAGALVRTKIDKVDAIRALSKIMDDQTLRKELSSEARKYVKENHTWKNICNAVLKVYERR